MKLTNIQKLSGTIELITGLHIGSGNTEMHIGGTDNPVSKYPPAKPGALCCEPLKAVQGVANAAPI